MMKVLANADVLRKLFGSVPVASTAGPAAALGAARAGPAAVPAKAGYGAYPAEAAEHDLTAEHKATIEELLKKLSAATAVAA